MTEFDAFKVRTLAEINRLGEMIEMILQNRQALSVTRDEELQHLAALQVLYWVRSNPDIEDMVTHFENRLRASGFAPPAPIKTM